ncbi:proline-rich receptor-like protein kinase PERK8 [Rhododendron vialii]|uniref:proline-rich receptor-like protein kinase PERK8 n=1 Tax=Rhododendron vialii TaxID=182163 RepID=UPI00265F479A|nr:proline-rich receptor-like protein kinase PERK8 [Rhododendron vialii]
MSSSVYWNTFPFFPPSISLVFSTSTLCKQKSPNQNPKRKPKMKSHQWCPVVDRSPSPSYWSLISHRTRRVSDLHVSAHSSKINVQCSISAIGLRCGSFKDAHKLFVEMHVEKVKIVVIWVGKPPQRFDYKLLKEATHGFSDLNFLAEGGFGTVHRGVLRDGQVVAVKQLKSTGSKGDTDFCREVRVLSCAQHRNVVLLIGFCVEGKIRLLVYEYVCNGSLDFHLHRNKGTPIDWHSRQKIAIGTARGLRYLHEDCRVGRVVHRNMQHRNILLTHDYEPLIVDFGLARLPTECDISDEQVVGTSRYLAPEYFSDGKITEKVDVYAFGQVLLELITGRRTIDFQCYEGRQMVHGNFHSLTAQPGHMFVNKYQLNDLPTEVQAMSRAAFLCLNPDPESRSPVPKVLRILETGDGVVPLGLDLNSVGSRSGYIRGLNSNIGLESTNGYSCRLSHS